MVFVTDPTRADLPGDRHLVRHAVAELRDGPLATESWYTTLRQYADGPPGPSTGGAGVADADRAPDPTEQERRRIRRGLTRTVDDALADLPPRQRLAVAALVPVAADLGAWEAALGADGWLRVLCTAVTQLDRGDVPTELEAELASFAAVAIYLVRDHLPATGRTADVLRYDETAARTAHLYPAADPELVAVISRSVRNSRGFPVDPEAVQRLITMIVQDDPLADAVEGIEARHPAWQVHAHGAAVLHVHGSFRTPFAAAAEALDSVTDVPVAAVWATSTQGGWALAGRDGGDLIHVEQRQDVVMWRHYRLGPLATPTRIAHDSGLATRARVAHGPLTRPFLEAFAVLEAAGVDVTTGAPGCF